MWLQYDVKIELALNQIVQDASSIMQKNHSRRSTDIIQVRYLYPSDLTKSGIKVNGNAQQNCMPNCYQSAIKWPKHTPYMLLFNLTNLNTNKMRLVLKCLQNVLYQHKSEHNNSI